MEKLMVFLNTKKAEQFCDEKNKELGRSFKEKYQDKQTTVVDPNIYRELSWLVQ
jgi:hypothetical protein